MIIAPVLGFAGPLLALYFTSVGAAAWHSSRARSAFLASSPPPGVSMFPFLMPSDIAPAASLTVWDASSSRLTLFVMLVVTLIFLPTVLVYTAIAFRALRGMVTASMVEKNSHSLY